MYGIVPVMALARNFDAVRIGIEASDARTSHFIKPTAEFFK